MTGSAASRVESSRDRSNPGAALLVAVSLVWLVQAMSGQLAALPTTAELPDAFVDTELLQPGSFWLLEALRLRGEQLMATLGVGLLTTLVASFSLVLAARIHLYRLVARHWAQPVEKFRVWPTAAKFLVARLVELIALAALAVAWYVVARKLQELGSGPLAARMWALLAVVPLALVVVTWAEIGRLDICARGLLLTSAKRAFFSMLASPSLVLARAGVALSAGCLVTVTATLLDDATSMASPFGLALAQVTAWLLVLLHAAWLRWTAKRLSSLQESSQAVPSFSPQQRSLAGKSADVAAPGDPKPGLDA